MEYKAKEKKRSLAKRFYKGTVEFIQSLFGPLVILLAKILRVKTGYKEGEKLILTSDYGNIKAKTKVTFVKLQDSGNPFAGPALVAVKHNDKVIVLPEYMIKERSYLKRALTAYEFNVKMIKDNPRLGKSHPHLITRLFYKAFYLPADFAAKLKEKFSGKSEE